MQCVSDNFYEIRNITFASVRIFSFLIPLITYMHRVMNEQYTNQKISGFVSLNYIPI